MSTTAKGEKNKIKKKQLYLDCTEKGVIFPQKS